MSFPLTENRSKMATMFSRLGIPTDEIAFYNSPDFLEAEQSDPALLEQYAAWVRARKMDRAYLERAREIVPRIAKVVSNEILRDGQTGVCIDASMMLTKMLEEQGIWCYAARGSLTISSPKLAQPTYFWLIDNIQAPGHVWVVAPPFEVVDVVLKAQPYQHGEAALVPNFLAVESVKRVVPDPIDFCSSEILREAYGDPGDVPSDAHMRIMPSIRNAAKFFPSFDVDTQNARLRYSTGGITVSDGPSLDAIKSRTWNGLSAGELYRKMVLPSLEGI